eukprot:CAMPEP_0170549836 /NCGR_PEP_ID=MMETSP0211-20121228/7966_1 /TAXON_ID=311385 /ORGANISM="Pseudokeronopsis sp., Strain OXSARD2" /LENGTH=259 /DNA_ID=CAMNT_0010856077 /DNA_START=620 /DNA_END=1399 /DNA_ORIENTATION=+
MACWVLVVIIWLPNSLNRTDIADLRTRFESRYSFNSIIIEGSDVNASSIRSNSYADLFNSLNNHQEEPSYKMLFKNYEVMVCYFGIIISIMIMNFSNNSISANTFDNALCDTTAQKISYFLIPCLTFFVGSICCFFLVKVIQRRQVIFYASLCLAAMFFITGPSYVFFGLDEDSGTGSFEIMQKWGYCMLTFFLAFVVYCLLPEIQCDAYISEGLLNELNLVDKISAIYCVFYGLGSLLAVAASALFTNFFTNVDHKKF